MNVSNNCNSCGQSPCQCHTTCVTPVACIPPELSHRATPTTTSVKGLLDLINSKCDKEICQILQIEISLLFAILELEHLRPDPTAPIVPGNPTSPVIPVAPSKKVYQLIRNMAETLEGDLSNKYASAKLLQRELKALWDCMYGKQQHHGDWTNNHVTRDIKATTEDLCFYDGDASSSTIKITIPVDVGSTVFHIIDGRRCLFESLVDNNTEEPSRLGVVEGKWLNYCDVRDVIDCVIPRAKMDASNCGDACDGNVTDGVISGRTMCERVSCIETQICDTECEAGVPTICERVTTNTADIVTLNQDIQNIPPPPDLTTLLDRLDKLEQATSLPSGAQTFVSAIYGVFEVIHDGTGVVTGAAGGEQDMKYEFEDSTHTLDPAQYKYLSVAGRNLILSGTASIAYKTELANKNPGCEIQWDTRVYIDGVIAKDTIDMYCCNRSGHFAGGADTFSFKTKTTGKPMAIKFVFVMSTGTHRADGSTTNSVIGDKLMVDKATATITFTGEEIK